MNTCRLDKIFDVYNGLPSNKVIFTNKQKGIEYKRPSNSFRGTNAGYIKTPNNKYIYPKYTLFVSTDGEGSHTFSYVSTDIFVGNSNISILIPKIKLSLKEKIYYATCITHNRFKFSYGRKPKGYRLTSLQIPTKDAIPPWVYEIDLEKYKETGPKFKPSNELIDTYGWKHFKITDIFNLIKGDGYTTTTAKNSAGNNKFISSTEHNNGLECRTGLLNKHKGNCVSRGVENSSAIFYHDDEEFSTNKHVILFYLKNKKMTKNIGLFLITLLHTSDNKYSYGRMAGLNRIRNDSIKLPINKNGYPDWNWVESFMENLKI